MLLLTAVARRRQAERRLASKRLLVACKLHGPTPLFEPVQSDASLRSRRALCLAISLTSTLQLPETSDRSDRTRVSRTRKSCVPGRAARAADSSSRQAQQQQQQWDRGGGRVHVVGVCVDGYADGG